MWRRLRPIVAPPTTHESPDKSSDYDDRTKAYRGRFARHAASAFEERRHPIRQAGYGKGVCRIAEHGQNVRPVGEESDVGGNDVFLRDTRLPLCTRVVAATA